MYWLKSASVWILNTEWYLELEVLLTDTHFVQQIGKLRPREGKVSAGIKPPDHGEAWTSEVSLWGGTHSTSGNAGVWGKCQKSLNWMNCSHFSVHYISMGHMLRVHLLLLPWELTQRQSQNGCFNAKHIRRPESWRRCCLGLPGYTWLGSLCSRPWERLIQVLMVPGPKGSQAKGWTNPGPARSWSPSLPSRASGAGEVDLLSRCHGGAPKSYGVCETSKVGLPC